MQIRTKMMYQLTQVRMAIINKSTNKFWRGYGEKKPFCTVEQVSKLRRFSCIWLCDPIDCSPPGSSVHGTLQTRILEWVVMPSSMGSSQHRDQTQVSCISCIAGNSLPLSHWGTPIHYWWECKLV